MAYFHPFSVVEVVMDAVIHPTPASFIPMFLFAFANDVVGIFPFSLYLAGQLAFLKGTFSLALAMKLLVFVAVPVGLGSGLGSVPLYLAAYFGGKPLINKFQRFLRFSWTDVEKVRSYFKGSWYDELVYLILRCIPILPSIPIDIAAGTLRMRFAPFFVLTLVGSIIRMMITLLIVGMSLHGLSSL